MYVHRLAVDIFGSFPRLGIYSPVACHETNADLFPHTHTIPIHENVYRWRRPSGRSLWVRRKSLSEQRSSCREVDTLLIDALEKREPNQRGQTRDHLVFLRQRLATTTKRLINYKYTINKDHNNVVLCHWKRTISLLLFCRMLFFDVECSRRL
jgi:hypothetical protein